MDAPLRFGARVSFLAARLSARWRFICVGWGGGGGLFPVRRVCAERHSQARYQPLFS